jgi:tRNA U34 2-thiouridine synthase MnmA/TrmU
MKELGASFIATGEVLGERPMSQRKDTLNLIEKRSELKGLLLRPLSAHHLEPTLPEREGVVKRELLMDIRGRSRKPQIALAKEFGIEEYMTPAGGCLLTDPGFTKRLKDLIERDEFSISNIRLLKTGRHFRVNGSKIVVGRNKDDNEKIMSLAEKGDIVIKIKGLPGPITLIRGRSDSSTIELAASLAAGYTKGKDEDSLCAEYWPVPKETSCSLTVKPMRKEKLNIETI